VYEEGSPIDAIIIGLVMAAGVVVLSRRSRQVGRFLKGNLPLLLFFAYCGLSTLWSDYPFIALKRWVKSFGDLVMVLVVLTEPKPLDALRRLFSRSGFVLLSLSVLFMKYYPNIGRGISESGSMTMAGVSSNKNSLGVICLVWSLVSLSSFLGVYKCRTTPHRVRHLAAHGILLATAIWILITCDSMTSLSCLLMAGAVMVMATRPYFVKHPNAVHALVGGCMALSLFALFLDSSGVLVHAVGRETNLTGRTDIWKAVLSMHTNPLVGSGFESFWMGNRLERIHILTNIRGLQEAHNGYLEVYLQLGWAGLTLLAGVIVTGYRNAFAVFRRDPHAGRLRLAFFTAGVIYSLTEAGFRMMSPIWLAFLLAVTFVPPSLQFKKHQPEAELKVTKGLPPAETRAAFQEFC
jgi:O-antigen ligase